MDSWRWVLPVGLVLGWIVLTRLGKISSERARELVAGGAVLIDVRSESEFASGHLPGATNVPLGSLSAQASELAGRGKPIVVYCASGMRSAGAKRLLRTAGADVYDLGAMSRW
jgi:rhodanese-related sulfurtransferase